MSEFLQGLGDQIFTRLGVSHADVLSVTRSWREAFVPKRSGERRRLSIPSPELLSLQRKLNTALFRHLPVSRHAVGFRPCRSIAAHALLHANKEVVIRADIRDFFDATSCHRVQDALRNLGWPQVAIDAITHVCFHPHHDGLPQGAATSPVLSNFVNLPLDHRLARLAGRLGGAYSRYADDLTFSFGSAVHRSRATTSRLFHDIRLILREYGYRLNDRKTAVMGRSTRQLVTGLVVNVAPTLPRVIRRRIRAAAHRESLGRQMVQVAGDRPAQPMTLEQLDGWKAFASMIDAGHSQARPALASDQHGAANLLSASAELVFEWAFLQGYARPTRHRGSSLHDFVTWTDARIAKRIASLRKRGTPRRRHLEVLSHLERMCGEATRWETRPLPAMQLVAPVFAHRGIALLGLDEKGAPWILGYDAAAQGGDPRAWTDLLESIYSRGMKPPRLVVGRNYRDNQSGNRPFATRRLNPRIQGISWDDDQEPAFLAGWNTAWNNWSSKEDSYAVVSLDAIDDWLFTSAWHFVSLALPGLEKTSPMARLPWQAALILLETRWHDEPDESTADAEAPDVLQDLLLSLKRSFYFHPELPVAAPRSKLGQGPQDPEQLRRRIASLRSWRLWQPIRVDILSPVTPSPLTVRCIGPSSYCVLSAGHLAQYRNRYAAFEILFDQTNPDMPSYSVPFAAIRKGLSRKSYGSEWMYGNEHVSRWHIRIVNDQLAIVKGNEDVWRCDVSMFRCR